MPRPTRLLLLQLLLMSSSTAFAFSRHITLYKKRYTFLDATKRGEGRGGGQQRGRDGEAISTPTTKTSRITNKFSSITSSITASKTS